MCLALFTPLRIANIFTLEINSNELNIYEIVISDLSSRHYVLHCVIHIASEYLICYIPPTHDKPWKYPHQTIENREGYFGNGD